MNNQFYVVSLQAECVIDMFCCISKAHEWFDADKLRIN